MRVYVSLQVGREFGGQNAPVERIAPFDDCTKEQDSVIEKPNAYTVRSTGYCYDT